LVIEYRIPEMNSEGIYTMKSQIDTVDKVIKSNNTYWKEFLEDLADFVMTVNPTNMIIAADWNEWTESKAMKQFVIKNGLFDVHCIVNNIKPKEKRSNIY